MVQLQSTHDTIILPLNENTYNVIKSFNTFSKDSVEYISLYDDRSGSVNVYNLFSQKMVKKIYLKKYLPEKRLYKTTVYTKNFDSIFVNNDKSSLYLIDSTGKLKNSIQFIEKPFPISATFASDNLPVFKDNLLYAAVRPSGLAVTTKILKNWKTLYIFDIAKNNTRLYYTLPVHYQTNVYGYQYLDYNFCYNQKGNFVFSFPADTNIYETDLADYHVSYFAKSKLQDKTIQPLGDTDPNNSEVGFKRYMMQDSYGPVYFDPAARRYLRVAKSRINENQYVQKVRNKKQRLIIFDNAFRIIGETDMDKNVLLNTIFFTRNGNIYARTKANDEYALHFVRLQYIEPGK